MFFFKPPTPSPFCPPSAFATGIEAATAPSGRGASPRYCGGQ